MRALVAIALVSCAHSEPPPVTVVIEPCEQRALRPALQCQQGQLGYDGCRWRCTLEPIEMEPARVWFTVGGYEAKE